MRIGDHQPEIDALLRKYFPEPNSNGRHKGAKSILDDGQILEHARQAKNAAKFASLFDDGDTGAYESDDSRADLALASMLAFWTHDPNQIDRLFRRSALYREKWNRADYRKRTIDAALNNARETYRWDAGASEPDTSSLHSAYKGASDDEVEGVVFFSKIEEEPKAREFLIEDICPKGYAMVIFGAGGVAKSIAAAQAGIALAGGLKEWFGLKVLEHGPVLYLDFELDVDEQYRRVRDLATGLGVDIPEHLAHLSGTGMDTEEVFRRARLFCKNHGAKAIIIDSMRLAMGGDMERSTDVLAFHKAYIDPLRLLGVTPIIVDHQGKLQAGEKYQGKGIFGSAFKQWVVRSVLQFEVEERNREEGMLEVRVRHTKTNFGPALEPFGVKFTFGRNKVESRVTELSGAELSDEDTAPARERIKGLLEAVGPLTVAEIAQRLGLALGTVNNKLSELTQAGEVETMGQQGRAKVYGLTSSLHSPYKDTGDDEAKRPEHNQPALREEGATRWGGVL